MQLTCLDTSAANANPEAFCGYANCELARALAVRAQVAAERA